MSEQVLFNKYHVLRILSKCEYSTVYLVEHIKLQGYRIIKQIYKASPCYEQLIGEARIMKCLKHSCIPQIYDIEENEDSFYIVEQYIDGESLKFICQNQKLREKEILNYAIQLCDLIHYLHTREEKILHLDIKPDNILVCGKQLFLVDFGSSSVDETKHCKNTGFGTPWFAAPEQYTQGYIDERTDIYGIGMLLYYMILGKQYSYMKGKNIDFCNHCSKDLKRIVNGCLRLRSNQRYDSVLEVKTKLSKLYKKIESKKLKKSITTIAIAGSQARIGVTYLAFQLAGFLRENRYSCNYVECNRTFTLEAYVRRLGEYCYTDSGYQINNISCHVCETKEALNTYEPRNSQYVIYDFGTLSSDNYSEFCKADVCLLVMGAKAWELDASEECLKLCIENPNIKYLFNFLSLQEYGTVLKNMKGRKSFRIPIEPRIFIKDKKSSMYQFLQVLYKDFLT